MISTERSIIYNKGLRNVALVRLGQEKYRHVCYLSATRETNVSIYSIIQNVAGSGSVVHFI